MCLGLKCIATKRKVSTLINKIIIEPAAAEEESKKELSSDQIASYISTPTAPQANPCDKIQSYKHKNASVRAWTSIEKRFAIVERKIIWHIRALFGLKHCVLISINT